MPLYTAAKRRFFTLMGKFEFDVKSVEEEFESRDVKNVASWGFTVERFRRSMVETYQEFAQARGEVSHLHVEQQVSRIATSVARNKTRPMPRARDVLRTLHGRYRLVLLTKGEYALQEQRIVESGFRDFFERVMIVDHKDRETFRRVVRELGSDPQQTWSIGDSLRSDIKPALESRMKAVWIPQETWRYETVEVVDEARLITARSIRELPRILSEGGDQ